MRLETWDSFDLGRKKYTHFKNFIYDLNYIITFKKFRPTRISFFFNYHNPSITIIDHQPNTSSTTISCHNNCLVYFLRLHFIYTVRRSLTSSVHCESPIKAFQEINLYHHHNVYMVKLCRLHGWGIRETSKIPASSLPSTFLQIHPWSYLHFPQTPSPSHFFMLLDYILSVDLGF